MTIEERLTIVQLALGKASVLFMSQPGGGSIVMPVEGLLEVAEEIQSIWAGEVHALEAKLADRDAEIERLQSVADAAAEDERENEAVFEELRAENERLRADLVWAVEHCTNKLPGVDRIGYNELGRIHKISRRYVDCDGTTESICRAVREARDGK